MKVRLLALLLVSVSVFATGCAATTVSVREHKELEPKTTAQKEVAARAESYVRMLNRRQFDRMWSFYGSDFREQIGNVHELATTITDAMPDQLRVERIGKTTTTDATEDGRLVITAQTPVELTTPTRSIYYFLITRWAQEVLANVGRNWYIMAEGMKRVKLDSTTSSR